MMKFTCLYNGSTLRNEFEIHKPGCRDITKHTGLGGAAEFPIEGTDLKDAVQREIDVYQAQDQGWDWPHFTLMPCARKCDR